MYLDWKQINPFVSRIQAILFTTHKRNENIIPIAILGKSGSGKSTFVDLILGLNKLSRRKILIGNVDIEKILNEKCSFHFTKYLNRGYRVLFCLWK
ncbi:ATP-binding cassette domain-containing protein [Fervidibacillus albus]|uniref:ATP-binding cassette domain-containing protein n=1 Tax=Fervidibacillus albus TaxID=2980026 RepID=UPI003B84B2BE